MTSSEGRLPLRTFITAELPETRIFIDRLYREFTESGRRFHIEKSVRKCDRLPWLSATVETVEPCNK